MVAATIALLFITGYQGVDDTTRNGLKFSSGSGIVDSLGSILNAAAADDALLYAAIIGTLIALTLTLLSRACQVARRTVTRRTDSSPPRPVTSARPCCPKLRARQRYTR